MRKSNDLKHSFVFTNYVADMKQRLTETTTAIETLKNDLNGKIYERRLIF
jgi:hypothetical protein